MAMRDPKAPRRGEFLSPEDHRRIAIEEVDEGKKELREARQLQHTGGSCGRRVSLALSVYAMTSVAIEHGRIGGFGPGSDVMRELKKTKEDAGTMLKALSCTRR